MLGFFVRAIRRQGPPDALYLDNGSTYRGEHLSTACARMGISLMHARPYDPPRAARWSASGAPCARAASISSGRSRRFTTSMSVCGPSSTSTTTRPRTPLCSAARPPACTTPPSVPSTHSTRASSATRSPSASVDASAATAPCRSTVTTGSSIRASSPAASSPSHAAWGQEELAALVRQKAFRLLSGTPGFPGPAGPAGNEVVLIPAAHKRALRSVATRRP
jgi:hypothetical protein